MRPIYFGKPLKQIWVYWRDESQRGFVSPPPFLCLCPFTYSHRARSQASQHSASSWQRAVYTAKDDLEQIRERIILEQRQADEVQAEEANVEEAIGLSGNGAASNGDPLEEAAVEPGVDVTSVNHATTRGYDSKEETDPADIQEDMKNIVEYFASATNGTNDEQLWAELHEKVCYLHYNYHDATVLTFV